MAQKYKTALVTGASSGMGKDMAQRLLRKGYTVYAAARSADQMADLAADGAIILPMDISKGEEIEAAVARILADHGGVDILINNAGYGQYGPVEDTPIDTARYQFEVNLFGLAHLTQLLIPAMRDNGKGLIINISSIGGKIFTPLGAWYHATKHALEGWSDCLRLELKPFGIDVVIIEPGLINTGFASALGDRFAARPDGPYAELAAKATKVLEDAQATGRGSAPGVIGKLVMRVVRARNPRTRYAGGEAAKLLLVLRWLISDRMFERLIVSQVS